MRAALRCLVAVAFAAACLPATAGGVSSSLLLSSAWCTFSYNKTTGYSKTKRVRFHPNGTYSEGSRAEGYSSGAGGSMASQGDARASGYWKIQNGELFMTFDGVLEHVPTIIKRNSNGYPVVVADGVEFTQCR